MTTIEILRQAVAGEIENRFNAGDMETTVTAVGETKLLGRWENEEEEVWFDLSGAISYWTHSPTPQPEVIFEHEGGGPESPIKIFADGRVVFLPHGKTEWEPSIPQAVATIAVGQKLASLHSSLKALEQEREQIEELREIAKRTCLDSAGLHELGFPNTALLVEKLHALSPYPREEQPR